MTILAKDKANKKASEKKNVSDINEVLDNAAPSGSDEVDVIDEIPNEDGSKSETNASDTANDELTVLKDKHLRLAAEYDNYRKRSAKEREMTYSDARADAITRLLPIYDNLERALKMDCADEAYYKGIEMIMTGLTEVLESMGLKAISAVGEVFDPNYHNAVSSIKNPELGENIIAEEFQKGFTLGDRVIRFSTVVVANS